MEPVNQTKSPFDSDLDQQPTLNDKQQRLDYLKRLSTPTKPKPKRWLLALLGVLIVAAGIGLYLYANRPIIKKATVAPIAISTVKPDNQTTSTTLTHYISNGNDLNLDFDYPSNWTVSPASGNNTSDQTISVNSPLTTVTGADGKSVTGKVTVSIRPVTSSLTELSTGTATSAQASLQIAYVKPTVNQFQYPFLIFIHLAAGANPSSVFEEVLLSGNTKFAKNQSITDTSLTVDPIITARFYVCKTNQCSGSDATPLSITNDIWLNTSLFRQTLTILESLQLN